MLRSIVLALLLVAAHGRAQVATAWGRPALLQAWGCVDFSAEAGVGACNVLHLAAGADGVLWVATSNGLLRYDGFDWLRIGPAEGLPSVLVRTVCYTRTGELWIGTDRGAGVWDGSRFDRRDSAEHLAGPSVRRIVEDPSGDLWFCCDKWPRADVTSGLSLLRNGEWRSFGVADGLPSDYVSDVAITVSGRRFVLTREGLAEVIGDRFEQPLRQAGLPDADSYVWSVVEPAEGGLLVAAERCLFRYLDGRWSRRPSLLPGLERSTSTRLLRTRDGVILTFDSVAHNRFLRWSENGFEPLSQELSGGEGWLEHLIETPDGSVWVAGAGQLLRWSRGAEEWTLRHSDQQPQFVDPDGRVWFASHTEARYLERGHEHEVPDMHAPLVLGPGGVACVDDGDLVRWRDGVLERFAGSEFGFAEVQRVTASGAGALVLAGLADDGHAGLVLFREDGWEEVVRLPPGFVASALSHSRDGATCILRCGEHVRAVCLTGDAAQEMPLPDSPQTMWSPGLFSGGGQLWLLGFSGLMRRDPAGGWLQVPGLPGQAVSGAFENAAGLWFVCRGTTGGANGLARLDDGRWHDYEVTAGNIVGSDGKGTWYLGGDLGSITVVPPDSAPYRVSLPLRTPVQRVVPGVEGEMWFGTPEGLLCWRPDRQPPATRIQQAPDVIYEGDQVMLRVGGRRRYRSHADAGQFQVSYRIGEAPWTEFAALGNGDLVLGTVPSGKHRIEVRVRDEVGTIDPVPAATTIEMLPPALQDRWWFWCSLAVALVAVSLFAGIALRSGRLQRELQARLQLEARYRTVVRSAPVCITELGDEARFESVNPAGLGILGLGEAALHARAFLDIVEATDQGLVEASLSKAADGTPSDVEFQSVNGRHLLAAFVPLREGVGRVTRMLAIIQDVTERRALEERLRHGQKMEAIGRLAGGIAHDFNNLLTAILGNAGLLRTSGELADGAADGAALQLLGEIEFAGKRAAEMTRQLLYFSRRHPGPTIDSDPAVALAQALPVLRRMLPSPVEVAVDAAERVGLVRLDPGQLEQILLNLIGNAADAMPDGGKVEVRLRRASLAEPLATRYGVVAAGEHVCLSVRDAGCGIPPEQMPHLFEPFFTTKPIGKGTGLGLASVHGIVARARGAIDVESRVGRGSEFTVWLPIVAAAAPGGPGPAVESEAGGGGETVLVCEDQPMVLRLVQQILASRGYVVLTATSGEDALEVADAARAPIDLLLTDVVMPGMGGQQLAEAFVTSWPATRVMFMSGFLDLDGEWPDDVLQKPFTAAQLLARVRSALATGPEPAR